MQLHDIKTHSSLVDAKDASSLLAAFTSSLPSHELLHCADSATLLVANYRSCGGSYWDVISSCHTFSVLKKGCLGYYR